MVLLAVGCIAFAASILASYKLVNGNAIVCYLCLSVCPPACLSVCLSACLLVSRSLARSLPASVGVVQQSQERQMEAWNGRCATRNLNENRIGNQLQVLLRLHGAQWLPN